MTEDKKVYPVGSYCVTTDDINPESFTEGEWELIGTIYDLDAVKDLWIRVK